MVVKFVFSSRGTSGLEDANTETTIGHEDLEQSSSVNSAYSLWFYVKDWNDNYGNTKVLFTRLDGSSHGLKVNLGTYENKLDVILSYYDPDSSGKLTHTCTVYDVPIQAWNSLVLSIEQKSVDIFMNGKLVKSCLLPGVPFIDSQSDVVITPKPTTQQFSGFTASFKYYTFPVDPQKAWNIYKLGYSDGFLSFLTKYEVQISVLDDGVEETTITF